MFRIRAASASGDSFERELEAESLTIGRSSTAGLTLTDRFLSREHARLYREGDGFMIEDLGSRNGTSVNGVRIQGPTQIRPGDRIGLSAYTLTLETDTAPRPAMGSEGPGLDSLDGSILVPASELLEQGFDLDKTVLGSLEGSGGELDLYLERLRLLDEVHRSLASSISLGELLDLILDRVFEQLGPEEGVIVLKRDDGDYETVARRSVPGLSEHFFYSETLVEEVAEKRQAALVLDAQEDERFAEAASILDSGVRSIVAAPLAVDDESLGLIAMSSRISVRQFEEKDLELLGSLASVAALRLRNVSLAIEAAEKHKLQAEVALARSIQEQLLPRDLPEVPGYDLVAMNRPSQGVSGDLYQVLETESSGDFYLLLYDVSGKGLAASLLTATIEALSASPIAKNLPADRVCALVNERLEKRTAADRFATAFVAQLNALTGELVYASAGHNPVLLIRASGEVENLMRTGLPLGVMPDSRYEAKRLELVEGDLVIIYTDGFTEARDPAGREYGMERLERACLRHRGAPITELAAAIERDVSEFASDTPYEDDQTLLLLRRSATG